MKMYNKTLTLRDFFSPPKGICQKRLYAMKSDATVTALKKSAKLSPSSKLSALFDGLATAISSGGNLTQFLEKRSETLLFDYKLEREKYTKTSETFLDIYISIAIAAPMIMLILFVILATTGLSVGGLTLSALTILMLLGVVLLNTGFLIFLKLKQPNF